MHSFAFSNRRRIEGFSWLCKKPFLLLIRRFRSILKHRKPVARLRYLIRFISREGVSRRNRAARVVVLDSTRARQKGGGKGFASYQLHLNAHPYSLEIEERASARARAYTSDRRFLNGCHYRKGEIDGGPNENLGKSPSYSHLKPSISLSLSLSHTHTLILSLSLCIYMYVCVFGRLATRELSILDLCLSTRELWL